MATQTGGGGGAEERCERERRGRRVENTRTDVREGDGHRERGCAPRRAMRIARRWAGPAPGAGAGARLQSTSSRESSPAAVGALLLLLLLLLPLALLPLLPLLPLPLPLPLLLPLLADWGEALGDATPEMVRPRSRGVSGKADMLPRMGLGLGPWPCAAGASAGGRA